MTQYRTPASVAAAAVGSDTPAGACGQLVAIELQVRDRAGDLASAHTVGTVHTRGTGAITQYLGRRVAGRFDAGGILGRHDPIVGSVPAPLAIPATGKIRRHQLGGRVGVAVA
jgi:hypothetical protein